MNTSLMIHTLQYLQKQKTMKATTANSHELSDTFFNRPAPSSNFTAGSAMHDEYPIRDTFQYTMTH